MVTGKCASCARPAKFEFEGHGDRIGRCGTHAYEWLGGKMPEWVEAVYLRGERTQWRPRVRGR